MHLFSWLETLNLINVLNYYLVLAFVVSTSIRIRMYLAVVGLVYASPSRWPKLLELVRKHRALFLGWPMLLAIGLAFGLMVSNSLAIHLVYVSAKVTIADLLIHRLPLVAITILGGAMLALDCWGMLGTRQFDRPALERDLDKAESWLESWMAPAVRAFTLGFVNPRKIVGEKVRGLLVQANWIMIGGLQGTSLRVGMQLAFGLSLWLTWLFALRTHV